MILFVKITNKIAAYYNFYKKIICLILSISRTRTEVGELVDPLPDALDLAAIAAAAAIDGKLKKLKEDLF